MSKREDILRKVQALIARAESTEFEAEREQCLRRADDMMVKYAIEEWEARQRGDKSALKPEMMKMDFKWYWNSPVSEQLWSLFASIMSHCSCVIATQKVTGYNGHDPDEAYKMPVFGMSQDIGYANMLFTSLYLQMVDKTQPTFDPSLTLAQNITRGKEAGMSWVQVAKWTGETGAITGPSTVKGSWVKMYRRECERQGIEPVKQTNPETHIRNFAWGYTYKIQERLREMRGEQEKSTGSLLPALRDAVDLSREAMYDMFGDLRPHPKECQCKVCKAKRKPVRYRQDNRTINYKSMAKGSIAGAEARIDQRGTTMPGPKRQLGD
jgi:hypothetical protein